MKRKNKFLKLKSFDFGIFSYVEMGSKEQPSIVLIHGLMGSSLSWLNCIVPLSKKFHVIALDLPGHGISEPNLTNFHPNYINVWITAALERLGVVNCFLVGHSFSALAVNHILHSSPSNFSGYRLVCPLIAGYSRLAPNVMRSFRNLNEKTCAELAKLMLNTEFGSNYEMTKASLIEFSKNSNSITALKSIIETELDKYTTFKASSLLGNIDAAETFKNSILATKDNIVLYIDPEFSNMSKKIVSGHMPQIETPLELVRHITEAECFQ